MTLALAVLALPAQDDRAFEERLGSADVETRVKAEAELVERGDDAKGDWLDDLLLGRIGGKVGGGSGGSGGPKGDRKRRVARIVLAELVGKESVSLPFDFRDVAPPPAK